METTQSGLIGKIRRVFWPIYGIEHKKFLPMAAMIGLILFNYSMLRGIKDALIVTNTGSETITFLKVWAVVPAAFIFFLLFAKLTNIVNKRKLLYIIVIPFLVFFALFALVLYPNRDVLHPTESVEWLKSVLPAGFHGVISMYRYWLYSLFYTLSELWGSAVLSLMFWQFANDVTPVKEAKRFYAHFYLLGNLAVILAGFATRKLSQVRHNLPEGVDAWGVSLNYMMTVVVVCGLLMLAIYYAMNRYVLTDPRLMKQEGEKSVKKKKKPKLTIKESMTFLLKSKYLGLIALLVISYGIAINLIEVSWKHQVHLLYPTENEYGAFMGLLLMVTGLSTFLVIFVGSSVVRVFGWRPAALATPIILGATGAIFFACVIFPGAFAPMAALFGITPLMMAVAMGFAQNILSKSTKYSMFDPTKEMAYIPLDDESKIKGKAAVDVVGARLGKSGGSLLQQAMFMVIGPIGVIAPYAAAFMLAVIVMWIMAVNALNKRFLKLSAETES